LAAIVGIAVPIVATYSLIVPAAHPQLRIIQSLEIDPAPSQVAGISILLFPDKVSCPAICAQALASGRYQVVARSGDAFRKLTLRVHGACTQDFFHDSYGLFLSQGYVDLCADSEAIASPDNAVVVREFRFERGSVAAITGAATVLRAINSDSVAVESGPVQEIAARIPDFAGTMYEVALRRDGQEKIIGRRFSGDLTPPPGANAGQGDSTAVGPGFEPRAFYAQVFDLTPASGPRAGPASLATIFDILEARMDAASPIDKASGTRDLPLAETFSAVAANAGPEESALVRDRIERYIRKDRPIFVHAVLNTLYFQHADPAEIKAVLLRFLDSRNPDCLGRLA
jgi:hypothetical protein